MVCKVNAMKKHKFSAYANKFIPVSVYPALNANLIWDNQESYREKDLR